MIIESLSVTDFRVFQGKHDFDLKPRTKYGKIRPIILFGGLNGAGKTTTLTAVRLALYGRQSLGHGTTQKSYEEFLRNSIHRNKGTPIPANSSRIELSFTYATLGEEKSYKVVRQWMIEGNKITEKLKILECGTILSELSNEQCQAFLNELIPIGVSDLFFFDGEKISELAEDTGGSALGEAIKKLLGLDIIDTLSADLNIITRNQLKKDSSVEIRSKINKLESELKEIETSAETCLESYETANAKVIELQTNANKLEQELSAKGGAWASTREDEVRKQTRLSTEKVELENQLRELISSSYPVSIAKEFCTKTQKILSEEKNIKNRILLSDTINTEIKELTNAIKKTLSGNDSKSVNKIINKQFSKFERPKNSTPIIHDISDSSFTKINAIIDDALNNKNKHTEILSQRIEKIDSELDKAGKNIARAPEEANIKPYLEKLNSFRDQLITSTSERTKVLEEYKRYLREAMDIARKLDKLSQEIKGSENSDRSLNLATASRSMLKDFSNEVAKRKVKDLELEFVNSFERLARKEDVHLSAKISTKDFSVRLLDHTGVEVHKDELSAGEKQIYAIAILEALAKTSGRHLPIIIDTPLGRLDSIHREKLVCNYFPSASHQVIILSTDTEVDESFYKELSTSISHAYKLDYDSTTASTYADEGYFWRKTTAEVA